MSGTGDGGPPTRQAGPRVWVGVAVGVVLVAGALLAVAYERDDGSAGGDERPEARSAYTHEFEAAYTGDVWIEVDAPDDAPRTVTITWGRWQRRIIHETDDVVAYAFRKNDAQAEGEVIPTEVTVEPAAEVTFAAGDLPEGSVDVNDDWVDVGPEE
jgi:hypothetical protein